MFECLFCVSFFVILIAISMIVKLVGKAKAARQMRRLEQLAAAQGVRLDELGQPLSRQAQGPDYFTITENGKPTQIKRGSLMYDLIQEGIDGLR